MTQTLFSFRSPSCKDIAIYGLEHNRSHDGLQIVLVPGKGEGVVTTEVILKGAYVTEYKCNEIHMDRKSMLLKEKEYAENEEGCYILDAIIDGKKVFFDATRRFNSYGRCGMHEDMHKNMYSIFLKCMQDNQPRKGE